MSKETPTMEKNRKRATTIWWGRKRRGYRSKIWASSTQRPYDPHGKVEARIAANWEE